MHSSRLPMDSRGVRPQDPAGSSGPEGRTNYLSENRPPFLDLLSVDPDGAMRQLHEFVHRLLFAFPPAVFRALSRADRDEMPGRLLLHLCDEDFKRLRSFRTRGVPFSHWLLCIARNMARDMIQRSRWETSRFVSERQSDAQESVATAGDTAPQSDHTPESVAMFSGALDKVVEVIRSMERKCQLLLLGSAYEMSPKELAWLLGWPASWSAKASDDRRYCRSRLRALLRERGLAPEELL